MTFSHTYYQLSNEEKIRYLKNKMILNKSTICYRAYWLIHTYGISQSRAMQKAWREAKEFRFELTFELQAIEHEMNFPYKPVSNDSFEKYMTNVTAERSHMSTYQKNQSSNLD